MNTALQAENDNAARAIGASAGSSDFLTIVLAGQRFGIPILQVQDVLGEQLITRIPLAPPGVSGALNLRGRIVTAIDLRQRLGLGEREQSDKKPMGVVVEYDSELYSLIIDSVSDVMTLDDSDFENSPPTLDPLWRSISTGIYRLKTELLLVLDVSKLLGEVHC